MANNTALAIFEDNSVVSNPKIVSAFKAMDSQELRDFKLSVIDIMKSPELAELPPDEVILECLSAASMGLPISKDLGLAFIVPFWNNKKKRKEPVFMPSAKGLKALALSTGLITIFNEGPVYEGELQNYNKMTGTFDLSGERKSDKVIGHFAYIELINGFKKALFLSVEDAKAHALRYSKEYEYVDGKKTDKKKMPQMWIDNFDAMATKTVVKKLLKAVPLLHGKSAQKLRSAIAQDDIIEEGNIIEMGAETDKPVNDEELSFNNNQAEQVEDIPKNSTPQEVAEAFKMKVKNGKFAGQTLGEVFEENPKQIAYWANLAKDKNTPLAKACQLITEAFNIEI